MATFQQSPSPSFKDPTAVHFGAGSIGLGFIGELLAKAGYHVIFADINPKIISQLNEDHTYTIHYLGPRRTRPFHVHNISGVLSNNKDGIMQIAEDIADKETKLITTSIGIGALKHIADIVAKGIAQRKKEGSGSLNIIACENGKGATDLLKDEVYESLDEETRAWADKRVGFADCSVDRIVPLPVNDKEDGLDVGVDKFFEWIVDTHPLKSLDRSGSKPTLSPPVPGMVLTDNLPAYQTRKLYIFNCGHAITAYLGAIFGHNDISSAIADQTNVFNIVQEAMRESGAALEKEYSQVFGVGQMEPYIQKTITRFQNPNVVDEVKRVGRNPLRKLSPDDRLLGPFHLARKHGLPTKHLAVGIAAALMYRNDEDQEAVDMKNIEEAEGIAGAVEKKLGLKNGSDEFNEVMGACNDLDNRRKPLPKSNN